MGKLNPRLMAMGGGVGMLGMVKAGAPGGKRPPASRIIFNKYDKDGDELIDAEEFKFMCMDLGHEMTDQQLRFSLFKIDRAGTGKISYEDFLEWWKEEDRWGALQFTDEELLEQSMLLTEFQAFDSNDDGVVDRAEFAEMYESLQAGGVEKPLETVLAELDRRGTGKISFNDYAEWLRKTNIDRKKLAGAAHAAATARANAAAGGLSGLGIEEDARPEEVMPNKVIVVTEMQEALDDDIEKVRASTQ